VSEDLWNVFSFRFIAVSRVFSVLVSTLSLEEVASRRPALTSEDLWNVFRF